MPAAPTGAMGRELTHEEAVPMLGAYAVDTLYPDEHAAVERHLRRCEECRAEVAGHRDVAGLLTPGWAKPPPAVWDRIAASLSDTCSLPPKPLPRRPWWRGPRRRS